MTNGSDRSDRSREKPVLKQTQLLGWVEMSLVDSVLAQLDRSISSIDDCKFNKDGPFVNVFVHKPEITRLLKDVLTGEMSLYTAKKSGSHGRIQPERVDEQTAFDGAQLPEYEDLEGASIVQSSELLIDSQNPDLGNSKLEQWVLEQYPFLDPAAAKAAGFTQTCLELRQFLQMFPKVIENQSRITARLEQYENAHQHLHEQQVDALIAQEEKAIADLQKQLNGI